MSTDNGPSHPSETGRRPSQDGGADSQPTKDAPPLSLQKLISKSERLREQPEAAVQWLESLEPTVPNTRVPAQIVVLQGTSIYLGKPSTFFEVLTDWVSLWFTPLNLSRKKAENLRPSPAQFNKQTGQLEWLLLFVHDYIGLSEGGLSASEIGTMVATVIQISLNTSSRDLIVASIVIMSSVSHHYEVPESLLPSTLKVLTASLVHVTEATEAIYACVHPLVNKRGALKEIFDLVLAPTRENEGKDLIYARGALRILSFVVGSINAQGDGIIDLPSFTVTLHKVAQQRIFKLASDTINACHTVLSAKEREKLGAADLERVLDTVKICLASAPDEGIDAPSATLSATNPAASEQDRSNERRFRERQSAANSVGQDLRMFSQSHPERWSDAITDYVLEYPSYNPGEQVLQCLEKGQMQSLFYPPTPECEKRCDWLLHKYLAEGSLPVDCRIRAVDVLGEVILVLQADRANNSLHSPSSFAYQELCSKLADIVFHQLPLEESDAMADALSSLLPMLASCLKDSQQGEEAAGRIVGNLEELIVRDLQLTRLGNVKATQVMKSLITIFRENLDRYPKRSLRAYDSLTYIAKAETRFRQARVEAVKILFRIRSTTDGRVYLTNVKDNEYIATALCRTHASADAFEHEFPTPQRRSASTTSLSSNKSYETLWMHDQDHETEPEYTTPSSRITVFDLFSDYRLDIGLWLVEMIHCLQSDQDWETYSYCLVNLGSQLSNISLFRNSLPSIVTLRQIVCEQLVRGPVREPPAASGLKKSDVALCLYNILTPLIAYATIKDEIIHKEFGDDLVKAFLHGIASKTFEGTDRGCIHALSLCALEVPRSVASQYPNILERVSTSMSKSYLTVHILEFLSQVASLPEVHDKFLEEEVRQIFAMCILFLERTREQNSLSSTAHLPARATTSTPSRHSGISLKRPPYRAAMMKDIGEPGYASALAYHTMICWFLSLKLEKRKAFVSWLVRRFAFRNSAGEEIMEEQSEVFVDMMQRTAFSDLGETLPNPAFAKAVDGPVNSSSWLVGYSIITAETAGRSGLTQITKRQASGTTHSIYQQSTTPLPPHHAPSFTAMEIGGTEGNQTVEMLPPHALLQMVTTAAPTSVKDQPLSLPKENFVTRALSTFDRISTVDSYKAGVLFVAPGQTRESEFLMLQKGSADYEAFLLGLGYEVSLKPPVRFNPQGLSHPRDGKSTIAWRDRVTEIVFLVSTMMPAQVDDEPEWMTKKMHVGNCHVNIIFNRSGKEWSYDNLPSDFNSINIIITPADLVEEKEVEGEEKMPEFYRVHVQTKDHFPNLSPAADPKIISRALLPKFVRILAINANVFSEVWKTKEHDKEFPSAWRARLQAIKRLKEQVHAHAGRQDSMGSVGGGSSGTSLGVGSGRRTPVPRDDVSGSGHNEGALAMQLDFGRWTS